MRWWSVWQLRRLLFDPEMFIFIYVMWNYHARNVVPHTRDGIKLSNYQNQNCQIKIMSNNLRLIWSKSTKAVWFDFDFSISRPTDTWWYAYHYYYRQLLELCHLFPVSFLCKNIVKSKRKSSMISKWTCLNKINSHSNEVDLTSFFCVLGGFRLQLRELPCFVKTMRWLKMLAVDSVYTTDDAFFCR